MYHFIFIFVEALQNVGSLRNRNFCYPVYFKICGEEKHLNFSFSDTVLCFETKTCNTPHNINLQGVCG